MRLLRLIISVVFVVTALTAVSLAATLEDYTFLKATGADARAVVKTPEGELILVKPGDEVGGAEVTDVADGRVVLRVETENGPETVIVRITEDGQKIQRIMRRTEKPRRLYAPVTIQPK